MTHAPKDIVDAAKNLAELYASLNAAEAECERIKYAAHAAEQDLKALLPEDNELFGNKKSVIIEGIKCSYKKNADTVEPYEGQTWDAITKRAVNLPDGKGLHLVRMAIDKPALKSQDKTLLARLKVKFVEGIGSSFKTELINK